jgi:hypothetical protein
MLEQLSGGDEQVKLIDFGIAKVVNPQAGAETEVAVIAGSRQYIAPEQLLSQTASPATDIYALSIIVYEMVTGRLPFNPQGQTHFLVMQELMRLQRSESFVDPRAFRPDLPEAAQILLLNALSFDSVRRPQNARIFAEDLAQALTGMISVADARATVAVSSPIYGAAHEADRPPASPIDTAESPGPLTDANAAARTSSRPAPRSHTAPVATGRETDAKIKKSKLPIFAGLFVAILIAAIAIIAIKTLSPPLWSKLTGGGAQTPTPQTATPSPAAPEAERTFNYSLTVRKDPKIFPNDPPVQFTGEMVFPAGYVIHVLFNSPQDGYLYIINESPPVTGQATSFNTLFPTPTTNQGSAQLAAGKTFRIPSHDLGFVLDKEQGTEKLWLIWAAAEVAELEPLKKWINPQDGGEIKDAAQIKILRDFLTARSAVEPQVTRDEALKQTTVKMKGDILVKLINLQHY